MTRGVRGDLDEIVMKALEKDRSRRYQTASGLALDVQRFLDGDPVEACPPSTTYKLSKLARKHRTALATAGAFVGFLLIAAVCGTSLAIRAVRAESDAVLRFHRGGERCREAQGQRDRAVLAERQAQANLARSLEQEKKAKQAESEAKTVLEFFQENVLASTRPANQEGGLGKEVTVRRAVDAAEPKIATAFADRPAAEASIRDALGLTYLYLGELAMAIRQLELSRQLRRDALGPEARETVDTMNNLALAYREAGRISDALPLFEATLKLEKATLGPDHPNTLMTTNNLANTYRNAGRVADALRLAEESFNMRKHTLGPDNIDTLVSMDTLANCYRDAGRLRDALKLHENALTLVKARPGPPHPYRLFFMNNLASAYYDDGRIADALVVLREVVTGCKADFGTEHPNTLRTMNNLAEVCLDVKQWVEAEMTSRECLAHREKNRDDGWERYFTTGQLAPHWQGRKKTPRPSRFSSKALVG